MKICPNCAAQMPDSAAFCTQCGTLLKDVAPLAEPESVPAPAPTPQEGYAPTENSYLPQGAYAPRGNFPPQGAYAPNYYAPAPKHPKNACDHTTEYDPADISRAKVFGILIYLTGILGILLALLWREESPCLKFHIREGLKLFACQTVVALASALLCWTILVPVAGILAELTLQVSCP